MKTDQLIHALAQDLSTPTPAPSARLSRLMPTVSLGVLVAWLILVGPRSDLMTTGLHPTLIKTAVGLILALSGLYVALRLAHPGTHIKPALGVLALIPLSIILIMGAEWVSLGADGWQTRLFGKAVLPCLLAIPLLALAPLAAALSALKAGAPTNPALCGAVAGLAAGGVAIIVYGLFCTENSSLFIGTWYLAAGLLTAGIGALAGKSVLKW